MKYIEKKTAGNGATVYCVWLNREEAEIMKSLVASSMRHTPKTIETTMVVGRMKNLLRVFTHILGIK